MDSDVAYSLDSSVLHHNSDVVFNSNISIETFTTLELLPVRGGRVTYFSFMCYKEVLEKLLFFWKKKMRIESAVISFLALPLSFSPACSVDMRPEGEAVTLNCGIMDR